MKIACLLFSASLGAQLHHHGAADTPQRDWGESDNQAGVWGKALSNEEIDRQILSRNGDVASGVLDTEWGSAKDQDFHGAPTDRLTATTGVEQWMEQGSAIAARDHQGSGTVTTANQNQDGMHTEQYYNYNAATNSEKTADNTDALHASLSSVFTDNTNTVTGIEKGYMNQDGTLTQNNHKAATIHGATTNHPSGTYAMGDKVDHGDHGVRQNSKKVVHGVTNTYGDDEWDQGAVVNHHCVRTQDDGTPIEIVPYGWSGVGHGTKYCYLEHCNSCATSDLVTAPGLVNPDNSEGWDEHDHNQEDLVTKSAKFAQYCPMVAHNDKSATQGRDSSGACGKIAPTSSTCTFVTCAYDGTNPMVITVSNARGHNTAEPNTAGFPEVSKYTNGRQHECRPKYNSGAWECNCNCYDDDTVGALPNHAKAGMV